MRKSEIYTKHEYAVKHPYTTTIFLLLLLCTILCCLFLNNIPHLAYTTIFMLFGGLLQINALENFQNVPCWFFPKGSAYFNDIGIKYKNVILEDVLFIPVCSTIFYFFAELTLKIPDVLRTPRLITVSIGLFIILEIWVYERAGEGARTLINLYNKSILIALLVLSQIGLFKITSINFTHMILCFIFVLSFSTVWEILNAWRKHWIYDKNCNALSKHGWIVQERLHIGITVQYPTSGFIYFYFPWFIIRSFYY